MVLLAVAATLGFALWVARRADVRPGAAIFVSVSATLCLGYGAGVVGLLRPGLLVLFWLGVGLLLWQATTDRERALRLLGSPAVVVFAAGAALHAWTFSSAEYHFYDEYAQWGLLSREILTTGELYGLDSHARRPTAPPAMTIEREA